MAKTQKFVSIPGFSKYEINRDGSIRNKRTGRLLEDKDCDHYSGRVSLYRKNGRKVTFNRLSLLEKTFS